MAMGLHVNRKIKKEWKFNMNHYVKETHPQFRVGDRIKGYEVLKVVELPEIHSFFYELRHIRTRACHIHISRNDPENTFCVAFKTVPRDSTGVAHILEHTVLCGSKKYPVRDPFFSMLKRSLNTFMNALTGSDWTMYPFCTQNKKDYYNLMSVYLDAVFFPKLDPLSFKQEGHRIEAVQTETGVKLEYKGVVYNEMKGAMSSPEQIMVRSILNALYPDTTYSFNSGGDPAEIPKLTHRQLVEFHQRHYHPSNAFFYTYGNLPLVDHLTFIEQTVLNHFDPIDPDTQVPSQPRWDQPKTATYYYPIDPSEDRRKKCQVCLAWLTADIRDAFEVLTLSILDQILIGNPGSPLRKALMDSELGSTLSDGSGYDADNKDTLFACGLKDVEASSAEAIENIIFDTFTQLAEKGIDKKLVESAVHQIEFHRKEITNSPFPYGLKLLLRISGDWFHGGDPTTGLQFDALMDRFFKELDRGDFLENRIKHYFIQNPHRVRIMLMPDPFLSEKETLRVDSELSELLHRLTESELQEIQHDALALQLQQEAKEDLSCLPTLKIQDISPDIQRIDETHLMDSSPATCYEQPTSGIFYFSCAMGIGALSKDLLPLLPFFCTCLVRSNTRLHSYAELAHLLDLYTGGMGVSVNASSSFKENSNGVCLPIVSLNAKCLSRNISRMFELILEVLYYYDFSDLSLLRRLLYEYRAEMESAVVENGHRFAISLASRNYSAASMLNEIWHGIHQLKIIKDITEDLTDQKLQKISDQLHRIASEILKFNNMKIALVGEKNDLMCAIDQTLALKSKIGQSAQEGFHAPNIEFSNHPIREGWSTASAVSFVARVFEACRLNHEDAPALAVISKLLRSLFLHREIREKGGAYGGFAAFQLENGLFAFGSYRDPHILNTLNVYEEAATFILSGDYTEENIHESILQICADIDRPDTPGPAAIKSFYRKLIYLTDDMRQHFKTRLLSLTRAHVLSVAEKYFGERQKPASVVVISNENALKEANRHLKEKELALYRI